MTKSRRLGRFLIPMKLINDRPEAVKRLMGRCIVLKADYNWAQNAIEYIALCEVFREVPEGLIELSYRVFEDTNGVYFETDFT